MVKTIVDIVLILLLARLTEGNFPLRMDVDSEHVTGGGEVAAGLSDDRRTVEVLLEQGADMGADLLKAELLGLAVLIGLRVGAGPSATEIEQLHLETKGSSLIENGTSIHDGAHVRVGVIVAGTHVEGDTDDLDSELLSALEHSRGFGHRGAELGAEGADGVGVVGLDAEDGLAAGHVDSQLLELIHVVKGNVTDTFSLSDAHATKGLARVSEDDVVGLGVPIVDNDLNLALRGAVEVTTEGGDHGNKGLVVVTLDGVVGVDHREVLLELGHLDHNTTKVDNIKGIEGVEVGVGVGDVVAGDLSPPIRAVAEVSVGHGSGGVLLEACLDTRAEMGVLLEEVAD